MKSDYIEKETFELILELVPYDVAVALRISLETGLRIGDVLSLTPDNISDNKISVITQKTGKPMVAEITREHARYLSHHARWCFPSPKDASKHRTRQSVWACVKRAVARLSIRDNITPHTARKIFAVERFKRRGLTETQNALGHENVSTTLLYAFADRLQPRAQSAACRALDVRNGGNADEIMQRIVDALGGADVVVAAIAKAFEHKKKDTT